MICIRWPLSHINFRYLYCDEIQLEADNVLATLYVAKKYIVPHLARACVNYLETSLTAKNACLLLSQSRLFEEPELMQRCWEVIDAQVCEPLDTIVSTTTSIVTNVGSCQIEDAISDYNDIVLVDANADCDEQQYDLCTTLSSLSSDGLMTSSVIVSSASSSLTSSNSNLEKL